jgi:phosphatidylglycerophosphatase C
VPGAGGTRAVAAFDFDGTLTDHDSLVPFLARVCGWPRVAGALAAAAPRLARAALDSGARDAAKAVVLARALQGRAYADVEAEGQRYGAQLARHRLRAATREQLERHRRLGHEIVVVSASLAVYLDAVGRALEVSSVLCTALEVDDRGRCTGRMLGGNCRGPEKARRLREYLGDGPVELWVYGDSSGDAEMLAMADHPVRVHRRFHPTYLPAMPTA